MKHQGYVYHKDHTPMSGVRVSDGRNVVLTDENGFFTLPGWEKESLIFCSVLTRSHSDWYLPIEKETKEYIFHLDPIEEDNDYLFMHFSDTEIENKGADSFLPWIQARVKENNPKFLFHNGDLAKSDGVERHWKEMNFDTVGCPVRYSIGNHDYLEGAYGEQRYEQLYGPVWYSFDLGKFRYVVLAISKGDHPPRYLFQDQCEWLKNDLEADPEKKSLIVFRHNECAEGEDFSYQKDDFSFDFKEKGLKAWFVGHHHSYYVNEENGVLHVASALPDSGGIDSSPAGIRLVEVAGKEFTTRIQYNTLPFSERDEAVWETKLSGVIQYVSPISIENDVLIATCDDGYPKQCGVYRLDGGSGKILWFYPTVNSIPGEICHDGEKVFAQDSEGRLYCISAENGKELWKTEPIRTATNHMRCSLALHGKILYAGSGGNIFFYDKDRGEILFRGERTRGDASPAKTILSPDGKTVYYSAQWYRLVAMDAITGETKWEHRSMKDTLANPGPFWFRNSTPLYHDGRIYAFGFSYGAYVDAETGELLKCEKINQKAEVSGSAVVLDDTLYLPTGTRGVVALDKDTLEKKYSYEVGDSHLFTAPYLRGSHQTVEATPLLTEESLVVSAMDGVVYFYDRKEPKLQRKIRMASPSLSAPILLKDSIISAGFDGTVRKYSIPSHK